MKKIILFFLLIICVQGYTQKEFHKREIVKIDDISILSDNLRLYIDVQTNKPLHFQLWNNDKMILNGVGNGMGEESFPVKRGRYKLIIFEKNGGFKTKYFRI